jgi:S-(hydroxymethyl)glutathione dehydrogenase / alcohol dehydrogenase
MKIRAAVCHGAGQPLVIETLDLRAPGEGEVVVRVKASGLCHSDLNVIDGKRHPDYPVILGHEGAGIVAECGPGVTTLKPGDHVIFSAMPHCGHCDYCDSRKTHQCREFQFVSNRANTPLSLNGEPVLAMAGLGTFADHALVHEHSLAKIRDDAPLDVVCYISCGVMTGVGAVIATAKVEIGSSVAIFGVGGVGLNVLQGARLAGATRIIAVDSNPAKAEIARRFGATDFLDPATDGDIVAAIKALTNGGADYSFECVGHGALITQAFDCLEPAWGVCTLLGVPPDGTRFDIPPSAVVTSGRRLQGSLMGGLRGRLDLPRLVDWYMGGSIAIDDLITHRMPLDEINAGFELMRRGETIRSVVTF